MIRGRLLVYLAEQATKNGGNRFEIPFDRRQLADYPNAGHCALSKELGRMKREGLINYRKNRFELIEKRLQTTVKKWETGMYCSKSGSRS